MGETAWKAEEDLVVGTAAVRVVAARAVEHAEGAQWSPNSRSALHDSWSNIGALVQAELDSSTRRKTVETAAAQAVVTAARVAKEVALVVARAAGVRVARVAGEQAVVTAEVGMAVEVLVEEVTEVEAMAVVEQVAVMEVVVMEVAVRVAAVTAVVEAVAAAMVAEEVVVVMVASAVVAHKALSCRQTACPHQLPPGCSTSHKNEHQSRHPPRGRRTELRYLPVRPSMPTDPQDLAQLARLM